MTAKKKATNALLSIVCDFFYLKNCQRRECKCQAKRDKTGTSDCRIIKYIRQFDRHPLQ